VIYSEFLMLRFQVVSPIYVHLHFSVALLALTFTFTLTQTTTKRRRCTHISAAHKQAICREAGTCGYLFVGEAGKDSAHGRPSG
jgi:hypothetical protein